MFPRTQNKHNIKIQVQFKSPKWERTYRQSLQCWSSPGWRRWRWQRCLQRGRDILISHSVCPCRWSQVGCFCACFSPEERRDTQETVTRAPFFCPVIVVIPAWVFKLQVDQFEPHSVCTLWWWTGWFTPPAAEIRSSPAQEEWLGAWAQWLPNSVCKLDFSFFVLTRYIPHELGQTHADGALISSPCSGFPFLPDWREAPPILAFTLLSGGQNSGPEHARSRRFPTLSCSWGHRECFWEKACCFWQH